ncbi:hypothetical protein TWF173_010254 [Orbilia oligospora]|nr:hypothetical protein TWF173_010254 [Orbilia oligospora]
MTNPINKDDGGPSSHHRDSEPPSQLSQFSQPSQPSQPSTQSQPSELETDVDSVAVFVETSIPLPLNIQGDSVVPPGPDRELVHTRDESGQLSCAKKHLEATAVLLFENPNDIKATAYNEQLVGVTSRDIRYLHDLVEFVRDKVASCALCQLAKRDSEHHLPNCPFAQDLGTFLWDECKERKSDPFEQAVFALAALVRLVSPSYLYKAAIWLDEDVPSDYPAYKEWCLEPADFLGFHGTKAHRLIWCLMSLWEDGVIDI